jgi:2-polyprenyl-3-methyl-5-hydroxy-6-metoxy-1,4-benzoquinol methylase
MILTNFFNKTLKNINKTFNSFIKLTLINKLFLIFLILLFMTVIFNSYNNIPEFHSLQGFKNNENNEKYVKKIDTDVYDSLYSESYDTIYLNKKRNNYELEQIKKILKNESEHKILDVGSGTGYTVKIFTDAGYDIVGLDKSEAVISKAESNYPKCEFIVQDFLTSNMFDYHSFSHILCLGKTIYEIKNKELFFEKCNSILSKDGFLIINLVDREKFKPFVQNKDKNTLYDPEKYGKKVTELIVKFDKNSEFISKYKLKNLENNLENNNATDSSVTPYAIYNEKFTNFKTHNIRENEINLYMPITTKILNLAKAKDYILFKKIDLKPAGYNHEYLYVFKKLE